MKRNQYEYVDKQLKYSDTFTLPSVCI